MTKRSRVAAAAAVLTAAMVATACGGGGAETPEGMTRVSVSLLPGIASNVPIQVGLAEGIFAKHGIDLELIPQPSGTTANAVVIGGTADLSVTLPSSIVQSYQQGQDLVMNCGSQLVSPISILAPRGSGLPSTASGASWQQILGALDGATVGLPVPPGTLVDGLRSAAFREAGVNPATVTYVNVGSAGTVASALEGRQVTVADAQVPYAQQFTLGPKPSAEELIYLPADGPDMYRDYSVGWFGTRQWLEANPEVSADFCAAIADVDAVIADPAKAAVFEKAITTVSGPLEAPVMAQVSERLREIYEAEIPRESMQAAIDRAYDLGLVEPEPRATFEDVALLAPAAQASP
jgi:NitT/TauT family transport system substrate-binding protein